MSIKIHLRRAKVTPRAKNLTFPSVAMPDLWQTRQTSVSPSLTSDASGNVTQILNSAGLNT
jgi:hypothetical protein